MAIWRSYDRAAVARDVIANNGHDWDSTSRPVLNGSVKSGAGDFLQWLETARNEVTGFANSTGEKTAAFKAGWPFFDGDMRALIGDSKTNPRAYFEFVFHVEAEECSQDGYVRVDTRTGQVVILRAHGC